MTKNAFMRFFAPDSGAEAGGSAGASTAAPPAAPVETRVEAAGLVKPSADFLRMIPGAEALIEPAAEASKPETEKPLEPAKPESEAKPDADADEVPETEAEKPHVKKMVKRIDKLTAKAAQLAEERDEIKSERDTLKQQLEAASQGASRAPLKSANPLAAIGTNEKLDEAINHAELVRKWALENWDGATITDGEKQEKELTAKEVRALYEQHDEILRKHAPAQRSYLRTLGEQTVIAQEKFPWLKDKESKEYQLTQQVLGAVPELKRFPDYLKFVGEWVHGHLLLNQPAKKKETPLAPTPPANGAPPPKVPQLVKQKSDAALKALTENPGSQEALIAAIAAA